MENFTPSTAMVSKSYASFDKYCYYAIYEHVNISFYAHKFLMYKVDAICLCFFFGLLQNGTFVLAKIWEAMIIKKEVELDRVRHGRPRIEHIFFERKKKKNYQFTKGSQNGFNLLLRAGVLRPQPRLGPGCPYIRATRRVAHEYESSQVRYHNRQSLILCHSVCRSIRQCCL